jgi:hypothetical protein
MSNEARRTEAQGETTAEVEFRGHTFTVSREYDDFSIDFLESIEEGKTVGIVRGALGPNQWRTLKSLDLKARDLSELMGLLVDAMGFGDAGNSKASSD